MSHSGLINLVHINPTLVRGAMVVCLVSASKRSSLPRVQIKVTKLTLSTPPVHTQTQTLTTALGPVPSLGRDVKLVPTLPTSNVMGSVYIQNYVVMELRSVARVKMRI